MFKLDLEPLAHRLFQNREIHLEYLKNIQEQADILWGKVKQAKAKQPLDNALDFPCKHAQRIQELLVYVQDTCPNAIKPSAKKVVFTPKNKLKNVRFDEALTSPCNINRILQTPSRNMKNKVEAQPKNVNKKNRVVEPIRNVDTKQSQLNANSKLICATCKTSMFDGVHDKCLLDFMKNVNSRAKSAKKHKNKIFGNLQVMYSLKYDLSGIQQAELLLLLYLDSGCSKDMTGNCSQLMNILGKVIIGLVVVVMESDVWNES
uniref:Uncharacterized protein n=1 Tax=Tanacetum cinerariifolium TaxID=118510 RepID=A0A6L2LGA1_TANCI|nr:hypothetical protein [Tanacetum cinerariifolium]